MEYIWRLAKGDERRQDGDERQDEDRGTGIKKEAQAAITEATRSGTIMILESRIRK